MEQGTSSSTNSDMQLLFQLLRCPGCNLFYDSHHRLPKSLVCGHSMCLTCLESLLQNQRHIVCLECATPQAASILTKYRTHISISTAPSQIKQISNLEIHNRQLHGHLEKSIFWCANCSNMAAENCYIESHAVENPQVWFSQGLAKLEQCHSGLKRNTALVLQEKQLLTEKLQIVQTFFNSVLSRIDLKIKNLGASEESLENAIEDLKYLPDFTQQQSNDVASMQRLKHLLDSFDPWSQEVECEWELSRRAELIATKNRLLSERPPPLRSSEETVFHATIEAVAEMLTGPTGSAGTVKSRISSLDATPIRWIHPADDRTIKVTFPGNTTSADPRLAHWMPNENGNNQLRNRVFVDHCIEKEPSDILRNNLCDEDFKTISEFYSKKGNIGPLESFPCQECAKTFSTKNLRKRHRMNSHPKLEDFLCFWCQKGFQTVPMRLNHQKTCPRQLGIAKQTGAPPAAAISKRGISFHVRNPPKPVPTVGSEPGAVTTAQDLHCCWCNKNFQAVASRIQHQKVCKERLLAKQATVVTVPEDLQCPRCHKIFQAVWSRIQHQNTCNGQTNTAQRAGGCW